MRRKASVNTDGYTTTAVEDSIAKEVRPEWFRVKDAVRYSGIGRSLLYEQFPTGAIQTKVLRKPGNLRGIRLVSVASLDRFIASLPDGNSQEES
jgi:hypothetical protein